MLPCIFKREQTSAAIRLFLEWMRQSTVNGGDVTETLTVKPVTASNKIDLGNAGKLIYMDKKMPKLGIDKSDF